MTPNENEVSKISQKHETFEFFHITFDIPQIISILLLTYKWIIKNVSLFDCYLFYYQSI